MLRLSNAYIIDGNNCQMNCRTSAWTVPLQRVNDGILKNVLVAEHCQGQRQLPRWYPPVWREIYIYIYTISALITLIADRYRRLHDRLELADIYGRQLRANVTRKLLLARVGSGNLTTEVTLKFDRLLILISIRYRIS